MPSFGENLRRERELRGVSLRDIADATKISVRFLDALEKGRHDLLPGGLFVRAFVKQYARHLGLDVDRTVADFLYAYPDAVPEKPPVPPPPRARSGLPRSPAAPWCSRPSCRLIACTRCPRRRRPHLPRPPLPRDPATG